MKKHNVWPGFVISRSDGERHYISGLQLVELYKVPLPECIIVISPWDHYGLRRNDKELIHLFPRNDGNYKLPLKECK